jgi:hypothetical protein
MTFAWQPGKPRANSRAPTRTRASSSGHCARDGARAYARRQALLISDPWRTLRRSENLLENRALLNFFTPELDIILLVELTRIERATS